jgi:hypothetical protein
VFLVLLGLVGVAALYLVVPATLIGAADGLSPRPTECPVSGTIAGVRTRPAASAAAVFGHKVSLPVADCSLWPQRSGCAQTCRG